MKATAYSHVWWPGIDSNIEERAHTSANNLSEPVRPSPCLTDSLDMPQLGSSQLNFSYKENCVHFSLSGETRPRHSCFLSSRKGDDAP